MFYAAVSEPKAQHVRHFVTPGVKEFFIYRIFNPHTLMVTWFTAKKSNDMLLFCPSARMAELVDARDLKFRDRKVVWVRFPLRAQKRRGLNLVFFVDFVC